MMFLTVNGNVGVKKRLTFETLIEIMRSFLWIGLKKRYVTAKILRKREKIANKTV
jgi:hypothetical protein